MFDSRDDTPVVGYKQDVGDGAPENVSLTKIKAFVSYVGDSSQCAPEMIRSASGPHSVEGTISVTLASHQFRRRG
jgi:hypothetical protein